MFEDPKSGLIALVTKAKTPTELRANTIRVIERLYTRRNDPAEVKRFSNEIKKLIPDRLPPESLEHIETAVAGILRRIEATRIRKAQEFADAQAKSGGGAQNRRGDDQHGRKQPKIDERHEEHGVPPKRLFAWIAAGGAVAIAGVIVYALFIHTSLDDRLEPNRRLVDQMEEAYVSGKSAGTHPFGGKVTVGDFGGRVSVTADGVPQDACTSIAWVLLGKGMIIINGLTSAKFGISTVKELCSLKGQLATITWVPKHK